MDIVLVQEALRRNHRGGIIEKESWRRILGRGIMEEESWRRNPGGGMLRRNHGRGVPKPSCFIDKSCAIHPYGSDLRQSLSGECVHMCPRSWKHPQ